MWPLKSVGPYLVRLTNTTIWKIDNWQFFTCLCVRPYFFCRCTVCWHAALFCKSACVITVLWLWCNSFFCLPIFGAIKSPPTSAYSLCFNYIDLATRQMCIVWIQLINRKLEKLRLLCDESQQVKTIFSFRRNVLMMDFNEIWHTHRPVW